MQNETQIGIELITKLIQESGRLVVKRRIPLHGGTSFYLEIVSGENSFGISVTEDFLADFPAENESQLAVQGSVACLELRMRHNSPSEFYCTSKIPVKIDIELPVEQDPGRAAGFVHVSVHDIRFRSLVAQCAVFMGLQWLNRRELAINPFLLERGIVNRIRHSIDRGQITFFAEEAHPSLLQRLEISGSDSGTSNRPHTDLEQVRQFIAGKVYWLAFKRGDQKSKTWINDPWDSEYLGVEQKSIRHAAQILNANGLINLSPDGEFASAGDKLLNLHMTYEPPISRPREVLFLSADLTSESTIVKLLKDEILPSSVSLLSKSDLRPSLSIASDIRSAIERADILLFDITDNNPNVLYELGFAHALKKNVVLLRGKHAKSRSSADISTFMYLPYDVENPKELAGSLKNYLSRYMELTRG